MVLEVVELGISGSKSQVTMTITLTIQLTMEMVAVMYAIRLGFSDKYSLTSHRDAHCFLVGTVYDCFLLVQCVHFMLLPCGCVFVLLWSLACVARKFSDRIFKY